MRQREEWTQERFAALINLLLGSPWTQQGLSVILRHILKGSREDLSSREQFYETRLRSHTSAIVSSR